MHAAPPRTAATLLTLALLLPPTLLSAQATPAPAPTPAPTTAATPTQTYKPIPAFDTTSIDTGVNPCDDFYKFACGRFAANHPIPSDQPATDQFEALYNVNEQTLHGILTKAEAGGASRSTDEQKIGDYFHACMDRPAIDQAGLTPIQPLLHGIDDLGNSFMSKRDLAPIVGTLQRVGVNVFFGFGEEQDHKDATKQIATIGQGGLGLPEKDYYLRTGPKDVEIRKQYVAHLVKVLTLAGSSPADAQKEADGILAFETELAKGSLGVVDLRDPDKTYHLQPISTFTSTLPGLDFAAFEHAVHAPAVTEIDNSTPTFFPALLLAVRDTDMRVLKAYMRVHTFHTFARSLPQAFDEEDFDFYSRKLRGIPKSPSAGSAAPRPLTTRSAKISARPTSRITSRLPARPKPSRWCTTSSRAWGRTSTRSPG